MNELNIKYSEKAHMPTCKTNHYMKQSRPEILNNKKLNAMELMGKNKNTLSMVSIKNTKEQISRLLLSSNS